MNYNTIRVFLAATLAAMVIAGNARGASGAEFANASLRPNQKGNAGGEGSESEKISLSPTGINMQNVSLRSCLRWAFSVRDSQIAGPAWLATQRYDIVANTDAAASGDEMKEMTKKLLANRFQLRLHRENRQLPVYAMVAGKKTAKLQTAAGGAPIMMPIGGTLVFRNYSMPALAERLATRPFDLDRQVIDRTGLSGSFDFSLKLADNETDLKHTLEGMAQGSADQGPSMITILQEQLGLSFKPQKAAVESLVIDSVEKVPSAN